MLVTRYAETTPQKFLFCQYNVQTWIKGFEDLYPQNIRCQNNNTLSKKTRKIPVKTGQILHKRHLTDFSKFSMILFMLPSQQPNKFFKHLHDYIFCLLIHFLHKQNLLLRSINSTVATWQNSRNFEKLERCCQHPSAKEKKEQKRRRSRKLDIFHQFPSVARWKKCCLSLIGFSRRKRGSLQKRGEN